MQKRAEQTRRALIRATAELIGDGGVRNAGLVNICRAAGVSRGALYHHFDTTEALAAAVHGQAHQQLTALVAAAFEASAHRGAARFSLLLVRALREDVTVRAGLQLDPHGSDGGPRLLEEVLGLVRDRMKGLHEDDVADLAVVVTAGLESLGRRDAQWWDPATSERLWALLGPLFDPSARVAPEGCEARPVRGARGAPAEC
ncbi:TetR family transcriptional regulator [Streptomyces sp. NPDC058701]|uniref:TetR family transcriptional regulator n=1 Tax=Streptomyces sp. NPDC058701 TaxID=3346608 RepID=UPI00364B1AA5